MARIIVTAVAAFAFLLALNEALQLKMEKTNAANSSAAIDIVDAVAQDIMMTGAAGIPMGALVAGVATVLFVALVVSR